MMDPRDVDPDRSFQHKDTDPEKLRDQLNENWKQLRLLRAALSDRDEVIATLHGSIRERDELVKTLEKSIKLRNRARTLVYAVLGGASTKLVELIFMWLLHAVSRR